MPDLERPWEEQARRAVVEVTELEPVVGHRLQRRLSRPPRQASPLTWALPAAALAAAVLVVALGGLPGSRPSPTDFVAYDFRGEGTMAGTDAAPHLVWHEGTVEVEVEPDRGVDLTVSTDEATVRVVGTVFSVTREDYATEVSVSRGKVAVSCVSGTEAMLGPGERARCLPDALPTLLLRATALAGRGAPLDVRLETLDHAGEIASPGTPAAGELLAHRVRALEDAGRLDEAAAVAQRYLDAGHASRRGALLGFVARHRYERDGCDAEPLLEDAVADLGPGGEAVLLASCLVNRDPARARALVDASAEVVDDTWTDAIAQLRAALGQGGAPR